jgi:3-isopropylmalate dehydrogenase
LMLDISFGLKEDAAKVMKAVDQVLKKGFRTGDIANAETDRSKILGTKEMGEKILEFL